MNVQHFYFYLSNNFKTSEPKRNEEFKLPDETYSVLDIQDYFDNIIKKIETFNNSTPTQSNGLSNQDITLSL